MKSYKKRNLVPVCDEREVQDAVLDCFKEAIEGFQMGDTVSVRETRQAHRIYQMKYFGKDGPMKSLFGGENGMKRFSAFARRRKIKKAWRNPKVSGNGTTSTQSSLPTIEFTNALTRRIAVLESKHDELVKKHFELTDAVVEAHDRINNLR